MENTGRASGTHQSTVDRALEAPGPRFWLQQKMPGYINRIRAFLCCVVYAAPRIQWTPQDRKHKSSRRCPWRFSGLLNCCWNAWLLGVLLDLLVFFVIFLTVVTFSHDAHFFFKNRAHFGAKSANLLSGGRRLHSMKRGEYQISVKIGQIRPVSSRLRFELFFFCEGLPFPHLNTRSDGVFRHVVLCQAFFKKKGSGTNSQMAQWVLCTIGS